MTDRPIPMRWQGDSFTPLNSHWGKQADKQFVVGQVYTVVTVEERSMQAHRHFFACLAEAFNTLPETVAPQFPSQEHLRKWALVQSGFADERSIVCASKAEAQRVAAFIKPMDEYAVVVVRDATIKVFTAQSQSMKAMGKADFQRSKTAVLDVIANLIGVTSEALLANAKDAPPTVPSQHRERASA